MSTVDRPKARTLPPLVAGQQLDQPTFHERYEAMPPETRAELVGGVVYMPSPLRTTMVRSLMRLGLVFALPMSHAGSRRSQPGRQSSLI